MNTHTLKVRLKSLCCAAALTLGASAAVQADDTKTMVLVHGAHFTAAAWQPLQQLMGSAVNTVAVDLPGRNDNITPARVSLELSAGMLCKSLGAIAGQKTLVAHSQGGAIVNAALELCPAEAIEKIVYVTAVAPLQGAGVFSLLSKADEASYFQGVSFNEQAQRLDIANPERFADSFAQDATPQQRNWLNALAVMEPAMVGGSVISLDPARFAKIDKYYVFADHDRIISLESQRRIADSLDLAASYHINSGHLPMLTQSRALADVLLTISKR